MGNYIDYYKNGNQLPKKGKADALIAYGGKEINEPETFIENLVCIVENKSNMFSDEPFDAALICDEYEFKYVKQHPDERKKRWIIYER